MQGIFMIIDTHCHIYNSDMENADESTFVDYANQDFRIKGSTNGGALDESFDLNKIGINYNCGQPNNLRIEPTQQGLIINEENMLKCIRDSFEYIKRNIQ